MPEAWLAAYPSQKPIATWMPDLVLRIQQLDDWGNVEVPKCSRAKRKRKNNLGTVASRTTSEIQKKGVPGTAENCFMVMN